MADQSVSPAVDQISLPADTRIVSAEQLVAIPYKRSSQYGGAGGSAFADDLTEVCALTGLLIRANSTRLTSITPVWQMANGTERAGTRRGGGDGTESKIAFNPGEFIVRVEGRADSSGTSGVLQLTLFTSEGRKFGPYGTSTSGTAFAFASPTPSNGFFGRASSSQLDAIGFFSLTRCGG